MSISYEEALSTLQAMFAEPWTRDSLDAVLRHYQGHMENTVEAVLGHGDKPPQELIDKLKSGASEAAKTAALDEQLARALAQGQKVPSQSSKNKTRSSATSSSSSGNNQQNGRGIPASLPDDFLRIPGRKYNTSTAASAAGTTNAAGSDSQSSLEADAALARMLQDELFSEELARNPDFAHLAGRRPNRPGQTSGTAATRGSNVWAGPGFPARNGGQGGQPQPIPNIMEKLSEMGNTAKHRLALMAAQFKANNNRDNAGVGVGGGTNYAAGGSPGREMRGLLDGDDYDTMELASRKDL